MQKQEFITTSARQTQKLGALLAQETQGSTLGEKGACIICLAGDLGAGKTTFTQGLLKGLGVKGPYTSPTFMIMKHYRITHNANRAAHIVEQKSLHAPRSTLHDVYHIDAYRVGVKDMLNLGWEEMLANKNNMLIIEWPERIKKIIPKNAVWINFEWLDEKKRKMTLK